MGGFVFLLNSRSYYSISFHQNKFLPSDRRLVHHELKLHRCGIMINDYSEFLLHAAELQATIRLKLIMYNFF